MVAAITVAWRRKIEKKAVGKNQQTFIADFVIASVIYCATRIKNLLAQGILPQRHAWSQHGSHRMCKKRNTRINNNTHKNKRRTRGKKMKKKRWNPSEWRSILASTFTFELFGLHHQLKCRPWLFFFSRKLVLLELWRKGNRTGRRWKVADAWHWVTKWEKKKKEKKLDRSKWKCLAFRLTWNLE